MAKKATAAPAKPAPQPAAKPARRKPAKKRAGKRAAPKAAARPAAFPAFDAEAMAGMRDFSKMAKLNCYAQHD